MANYKPTKTSYVKGDPRCNKNGRGKGTKNTINDHIRSILSNIYQDNLNKRLVKDLDAMNPYQRQQILDKIASKFLPTLNKTEIEGEIDSDVTIRVVYGEDDTDSSDDEPDNN